MALFFRPMRMRNIGLHSFETFQDIVGVPFRIGFLSVWDHGIILLIQWATAVIEVPSLDGGARLPSLCKYTVLRMMEMFKRHIGIALWRLNNDEDSSHLLPIASSGIMGSIFRLHTLWFSYSGVSRMRYTNILRKKIAPLKSCRQLLVCRLYFFLSSIKIYYYLGKLNS